MNGLIVVGTASDVGKTMICLALCRILSNEGRNVAPFKSQNMSGFSVTLPNGCEISRSQFQQAQAARTEPMVEMNPILLKPTTALQSDVILLGKPLITMDGQKFREQLYDKGLHTIKQSLRTLSERYETVIIEGAGSTAEVNLMDRELTNMRVAELADVPALLVADISKGGAIASIIGTLQLLSPERRQRVKAIIINKFYGELSYFQDGVQFIENFTGIPVAGVIPVLEQHGIVEEDMERETKPAADGVDVYEQWAEHVQKHLNWPLIQSILA
ncbi:cobyric acid synthase [Sporosarcina sp. PTS2304]|uniref:cobyric acid synthase n=1 Tax=Sporosarcina sp. PTS2304 TaxID=2283194 RepID=UPI000E0CDD46|nr:cobyric acid synthase [Sporosarcina sp. PTS2304]AXI01081.1 cobyric acid synthase [Sporosarcina sp. PTS2304]